jgi:hypothetical protein
MYLLTNMYILKYVKYIRISDLCILVIHDESMSSGTVDDPPLFV